MKAVSNKLSHHVHGGSAERGRHDPVLQEASESEVGNLQPDVARMWIPTTANTAVSRSNITAASQ
jgi:hypothetical protein